MDVFQVLLLYFHTHGANAASGLLLALWSLLVIMHDLILSEIDTHVGASTAAVGATDDSSCVEDPEIVLVANGLIKIGLCDSMVLLRREAAVT